MSNRRCASIVGASNRQVHIPIHCVQIEAQLRDLIAHVSLQYHFWNPNEFPIEAAFEFPLEATSLHVCGFHVRLSDGTVLQAEIREKEEARDKYDDSIASGGGAYLMEQKDDDLFRINIGNLSPGMTASVCMQYMSEVPLEDDEWLHFSLPLSLFPHMDDQSSTVEDDEDEILRRLEALMGVDPPEEKEEKKEVIEDDDGSNQVEIKVELVMASPVKDVECNCALHVVKDAEDERRAVLVVQKKKMDLHRDISFRIKVEEPTAPRSCMEKDVTNDTVGVMVSLHPLQSIDLNIECEMIFLVDQSGSMSGSKMKQACETLQLFLRSLPQESCFNIIGFGSTFHSLFPNSAQYSEDTMQKAAEHVAAMTASLGGTVLEAPLRQILRQKPEKAVRIVFLLTDGAVNNTQTVIDLVKTEAKETRIFTVGIGNDVDKSLCEKVARAGRGKVEFVAGNERLQTKVMRQMRSSLVSQIKDIHIDWKQMADCIKYQAPEKVSTLFIGGNLLLFAVLKPEVLKFENMPENLKLKLTRGGSEEYFEVPVSFDAVKEGQIIHTIAASQRIKDLQSGDASAGQVKEIIELAKKYQLSSKYTSFIVVESRDTATLAPMKLVEMKPAPKLNSELFHSPAKSSVGSGWLSFPKTLPGMSLFGAKKPQAAQTQTAVGQLKQTLRELDRREKLLERNASKQHREATQQLKANNKQAALLSLKRKKMYEEQRDKLAGSRLTLETQVMGMESAQTNLQSLSAMRSGSASLKASISIDQVDDMMDDIMDQMDVASEISSACTAQHSSVNEDDLFLELEELEGHVLCEQGLSLSSSQAPVMSAQKKVASGPPPTKIQSIIDISNAKKVLPSASVTIKSNVPSFSTESTKPVELMERLIQQQHSDGHWEMTAEFQSIMSVPENATQLGDIEDNAVRATLVALAFLESFYSHLADEWLMLAAKAKKWAQSKLKCTEETFAELLHKAATLLTASK